MLRSIWKLLDRLKLFQEYDIEIKDIKLLTPYILCIDFTSNGEPHYLTIDGNYINIRKQFIQKKEEARREDKTISFFEFLPLINILVPAKDIVLSNKKKWIKK